MHDPYDVVRQFEAALCEYTGAPMAVTTTSCTMAILLACAWFRSRGPHYPGSAVTIPKRTYVGVPMSIRHAGYDVLFRDTEWRGEYDLDPLPVWDSARRFTSGMFKLRGHMLCVSFHHTKILGLAAHGGAILHDNTDADAWLRRARFDGRTEGIPPCADAFQWPAWHCYITPPTAAEGLLRLASLPRHNEDLPCSDYPDLSQLEVFNG